MKSFQLISLFALISAALAFAPNQVAKTAAKVAAGSLPVASIVGPAIAFDSIVESLPSNTVALQVQFGAYLAVVLGVLLPCVFLINLYIQDQSRKAGRAGGIDAE